MCDRDTKPPVDWGEGVPVTTIEERETAKAAIRSELRSGRRPMRRVQIENDGGFMVDVELPKFIAERAAVYERLRSLGFTREEVKFILTEMPF